MSTPTTRSPTPIPPYDPADPAQRDDPYPLFARLQDEDPVHWSPALRAWVLTRYDDVREAMNTDALSPDRLRPFYAALKDERRDVLAEVMRYLSLWMVFRDPPEHTRLRRLMGGVFTPRAIEQLAPAITAVVDELLDPLDDARRRGDAVDWVRAVAMPLPAWVILDLLGVPRAHYAAVKAWSDELRAFIGSARADGDRYARARRGAEGMAGFFRGLIAQRRASPGSDFISRLIAARDEGGQLSEDELVASCMLVLFAGHETTTHLLGNAVHALLDFPDQHRRLREDPGLLDAAVEECLRYEGPSGAVARVVRSDHAIDGRTLRAGDRVYAMVNAANRDPRRFDDPQRLDLGRTPNRHLTFGFGPHFCLGAPLARLEGRLCLGRLVERFPGLRRADGPPPAWIDSLNMRGLSALPVRLG